MNIFKYFVIFFFINLLFLPVQSSQKIILNELFNKLEKVSNPKTAELLEKKIWSVWQKHPDNIKLTERLDFGIELMQYGNYNYAVKVFNNIIATDPKWSEAWNKRATVFFLMKQYKESLYDIEKVLSIEPRHFGALSGQARIFIRLQEYEKAIKSLEKAMKFYPLFKSGDLIPTIKKLIKEESI